MRRTLLVLAALAALAAALPAAADPPKPAGEEKFAPPGDDDLEDRSWELENAIEKDLKGIDGAHREAWRKVVAQWRVPEHRAWFRWQFGENGGAVADAYDREMEIQAERAPLDAWAGDVANGVEVERADGYIYLKDAVDAMRFKIPLYDVCLRDAKGRPHYVVGKFAWIGGGFRRIDGIEAVAAFTNPCPDALRKLFGAFNIHLTRTGRRALELSDLGDDAVFDGRDVTACPKAGGFTYLYPFGGDETTFHAVVAVDGKSHEDGTKSLLEFGGTVKVLPAEDADRVVREQLAAGLPKMREALEAAQKDAGEAAEEKKAWLERRAGVLKRLVAMGEEAEKALKEGE